MKINSENEALHQQPRYNGTNLLCVREGCRLTAFGTVWLNKAKQ